MVSEAGGGGGGGGREGDWVCNGCLNRNYAFRSFCNRCKQPRLLVDTKTPSDSKWLPRIGDWICTGCTNNNYASRVNCKKCGQPKEVAAMPAIAMPGASVPTHPNYFARVQRGVEQMLDIGSLQQSLSLSSGWPLGGTDKYGIHSADPYSLQSTWSFGGNSMPMVPFSSQPDNMNPVPNGWREGDWVCPCGYHNYSSRVQCKKCNAPTPTETPSYLMNAAITAVGTKRVASEEFVHNWDSKRLNAGREYGMQQAASALDPFKVPGHPSYGSSMMASNLQGNFQLLPVSSAPMLLGKGAKHWRNGDWMCSHCNNHNYASRAQCNRCQTVRADAIAAAVGVA